MFNVSEDYKAAISKPDRELRSRITLTDKIFDDSNIQNIGYVNGIVAGNDFEIGTAIMATIDIELLDLDYSLSDYAFDGKEIKVEIGIKIENNLFEYVPLGLFTVEKPVRNDKVVKLTASDRMYKFERPYISSLVYPATLLQIAQDICSVAGVTLLNTSFPNCGYVVNSKPVLDNVSCRTAIAQIAELAAGYTRITRDGKLEIFNLNTTIKNTVSYAGDDFITQTDFDIADELIAGVIEVTRDNYITFNNKEQNLSTIDKVSIKIGDVESVLGDGSNPYYIVDNIFCQNPNAVINELYNVLNGLSYMPFSSKWQGNPAIDCGDMITIKTISGHYNTIATSKKLTYRGGLREEYIAVGKSNTEKNSTPKGSITIEVEKTKTEIKVLDGKIEQRVSNEEFESYIEQTAKEISSKVSNADFESYVSQTAEEISSKVSADDVSSIIRQDAESVKIGFNGISEVIDVDSTGIKVNHTDGSYTKMEGAGFKRYVAGTGKMYHSLIYSGEVITNTTPQTTSVDIQLPDEYKNKDFALSCGIKAIKPNYPTGNGMITHLGAYGKIKDKANGIITISGFCAINNIDVTGIYTSSDTFVPVTVWYLVIA